MAIDCNIGKTEIDYRKYVSQQLSLLLVNDSSYATVYSHNHKNQSAYLDLQTKRIFERERTHEVSDCSRSKQMQNGLLSE